MELEGERHKPRCITTSVKSRGQVFAPARPRSTPDGYAARQYLFRQKHCRSQGWIPAVVLRNLVVDILDVSGIAFVNGRSGNDTIVAPKFVDDLCGNSG